MKRSEGVLLDDLDNRTQLHAVANGARFILKECERAWEADLLTEEMALRMLSHLVSMKPPLRRLLFAAMLFSAKQRTQTKDDNQTPPRTD